MLQMSVDPNKMELLEHLAELRTRLLHCIVAIGIGAVVAYCVSESTFAFLTAPFFDSFPGQSMIGTGPAEAFLLKLKVAFFTGVVVSSPYLFLQIWLFIAPGLLPHEKTLLLPFIFVSTLLFAVGIAFSYYVVLPFAFDFFFTQFTSIGITPTIRVSEHLSLIIKALLGFGCVFEMPVIAYFLGRLGIIDHHFLLRYGRHAVVAIFVVAAVLTPPDIITQLLMAGPLLLLYGISILLVKYTAKAPEEDDEEEINPATY